MNDTVPTGAPASDMGDVLAGTPTDQPAATAKLATGMYSVLSGGALLAAWIRLARPRYQLIGLAPVAVTLALLWARGANLLMGPVIFTFIALTLVQSGAHLLDEYVEFERALQSGVGVDAMTYDEAGAVLAMSGMAPLTVLRVSACLFACGALAGIPLIAAGGPGEALLGICGLTIAFFYAATSYALKRLPGGEVVVFLALGPGLVVAVALAQHVRPDGALLLVGFALGLLALAMMEATHLSTTEEDARTWRITLVSYIGVGGARLLYCACVLGAFVLIILFALHNGTPHGALAVLLALPAALIALTSMLRARNASARALIRRQTYRVYILFAVWLFLGLLASGAVARVVSLVLHARG